MTLDTVMQPNRQLSYYVQSLLTRQSSFHILFSLPRLMLLYIYLYYVYICIYLLPQKHKRHYLSTIERERETVTSRRDRGIIVLLVIISNKTIRLYTQQSPDFHLLRITIGLENSRGRITLRYIFSSKNECAFHDPRETHKINSDS